MIEISIDTSAIEKLSRQVLNFDSIQKKAARLAEQRALKAMRAEIVSSTSERYYMKSSRIKAASKISGSQIIFRGPRLRISDYYLTPKRRPKGRQNGLRGAVMKRGGIKNFPTGFIVNFNGGSNPVAVMRMWYKRGASSWDGLKRIFAPAIPQIVKNPEVQAAAQERGARVFSNIFEHEVLRGMGMIK